MHFDLDIKGPGGQQSNLKLDGKTVPFVSATVRVAINEIPRLVIEPDIFEITHASGEVEVIIPKEYKELLIAAGWTPPNAQE